MINQYNITDSSQNSEKDTERNRAFTLVAERIANSRATVETDPFTSNSPNGIDDTKDAIHRRARPGDGLHGEDSYSHMFSEEKGVLRSFKEGDDTTENKQIPLASNAPTNDTDAIRGTKTTMKRALADQDFEEIKEVDEQNDSFDARKFNENLHSEPTRPDNQFESNPEKPVEEFKQGKHASKHHKLHEEDLEMQNTDPGDTPDDVQTIFVEHKFCTQCNIEQPLRTKHCRSCKK